MHAHRDSPTNRHGLVARLRLRAAREDRRAMHAHVGGEAPRRPNRRRGRRLLNARGPRAARRPPRRAPSANAP
eukprot:10270970-Alexandrium_andersonii.AAC.1